MGFSLVGKLSEFWVGEVKDIHVGKQRVLMIRTANGLVAYQGHCPHQGVPLCDGQLEGRTLTCCAHGWQFDIETGQGINPKRASLQKVDVRIEDDNVFVDAENENRGPLVGPTVSADKTGQAIASAIAEQNSNTQILDRGSYLRIEAPSPCRLSRHVLQKHMEMEVDLPATIELAMSSFKGRIRIETDQIVWKAVEPPKL